MTTCDEKFYGTGWGVTPYGSPESTGSFGIEQAVAVRENAVQVDFSEPIYYSLLLDVKDGSNPDSYAFEAIESIGNNGLHCRTVTAVKTELINPSSVLIWLDRAMTPYPARYKLTCSNIWTVDKVTTIDPCYAQYGFYGSFKVLQKNVFDLQVPQRDIASPQTKQAFADPLPFALDQYLGVFNVDDNGDYGFDEGETALRKRILRRIVTNKNGFTHMPGYGIGIEKYTKKLSRATERQKLASDLELQLRREPEVSNVSVTFTPNKLYPNLVKLSIQVKTKIGLKFTIEKGFEVGLWIYLADLIFNKRAGPM